MRYGWLGTLAITALLAALLAPPSKAQYGPGDWAYYRGNVEGTGFSQLKQINTTNVSKLTQAWTFHLAERGMFEVTPIVVKGVMYLPAGKAVVALNSETGMEIWRYDVQGAQASTRGVAYWPGNKHNPPRIIFTTFDRKMISLDAATGKIVPSFGKDGIVEMEVG